MKTSYSLVEIQDFLRVSREVESHTVESVAEGHISQVVSFESSSGDMRILRISAKDNDFKADRFAYETFGKHMPIPRVEEIGKFSEDSFYCISEFVDGVPSNSFSNQEIQLLMPKIHTVFSEIFHTDVSETTGYGEIDTKTGNAEGKTWKECLEGFIKTEGADSFRKSAINIELDSSLVDDLINQFDENLLYASEKRRLFHGDPGFNNMLLGDGEVAAVLDWAEMGYGDWMRDFTRLDFWWPGRYGSAKKFAAEHDLESENLSEREALYLAVNALGTISFADKFNNEQITKWLHDYIAEKLII